MESLGFSDINSMWSDSPIRVAAAQRPAPPPPVEDELITDWEPTDIGARLWGSNMRWGVLIAALVLMIATGGVAFWLYQRPQAEATAAEASLDAEVAALANSLPRLEELDAALAGHTDDLSAIDVTAVGQAARDLFEAGAALPASASDARFLATGAASSALDGVRLAEEARAYALAVTPILEVPPLETDPALVALDDAIRSFGDWQVWFDDVRTALPDSVHPRVTEQLDVLSGDLSQILRSYVDALRDDKRASVTAIVADLEGRLADLRTFLVSEIGEAADRIAGRVEETREALRGLDQA